MQLFRKKISGRVVLQQQKWSAVMTYGLMEFSPGCLPPTSECRNSAAVAVVGSEARLASRTIRDWN